MAKSSIGQVTTAQTFQNWLDKTNQIVTLLETDVMTASALGDTTTGNATLVGSFTANTVIAFDTLRSDTISPKVGSTSVSFTSPVSVSSSTQTAQTLVSSSGPRLQYSSGSVLWEAGFENVINNNFIINTGAGANKLTLTPTGNLSVSGSVSATGGVIGNITGNVTGNVTGNLIGDVIGNVTGDVTGNADTASAWETARTFTINGVGQIVNGTSNVSWTVPTFPVGGIIMWSGSIANIPSGWALCNGSNGTPDLRDRFVVGAGSTYAVGATGGADSVTLTEAQMPSHTHSVTGTTNNTGSHTHTEQHFDSNGSGDGPGPGASCCGGVIENAGVQTLPAGDHQHTVSGTAAAKGGGEAHENRPPYYALAYIMKI